VFLSREYIGELKREAKVFLREAISVGDPNLVAFFAE
jgi:hypothetical protein